jgi:hypothetical protein
MIRTGWLVLVALTSVGCATPARDPALTAHERSSGMPPSFVETRTADGEILGVDRQPPGTEIAQGLSVRLQVDREQPIVVQLAPGWYLDENGIAYGAQERMTVRGRREVRNGRSVLIATEVRRGERWVPLRDEEGRPLWHAETPP